MIRMNGLAAWVVTFRFRRLLTLIRWQIAALCSGTLTVRHHCVTRHEPVSVLWRHGSAVLQNRRNQSLCLNFFSQHGWKTLSAGKIYHGTAIETGDFFNMKNGQKSFTICAAIPTNGITWQRVLGMPACSRNITAGSQQAANLVLEVRSEF